MEVCHEFFIYEFFGKLYCIDETTEYIDILGYSYTPELIFDTPFYYFLIDTTNDSILCGGYYE